MTKLSVIALSAVLVLVLGGVAFAAHSPSFFTNPSDSITGAEMYKDLCAGCHGEDGQGVGPTSPYCSVPPTNLTQLAVQNHGTFPEKKVYQVLRYGTEKPTQSTTYMPVWKPLFESIHGENANLTEQRIATLTDYLKSMQVKPASKR